LTNDTATTKADITPKTLTVDDVAALDKTYDGNEEAELSFTTDDIVGDDEVGFDYEALFASKDVGEDISVTVTDGLVTLTGGDAGNYTLVLDASLLNGLTAEIVQALLQVTIDGDF